MPYYDFECEPCAYYAEIQQHMSDPSTLNCPVCGEETLKKVFISPPLIFIRGGAKTVGQVAERNYKNMGFYEKQDRKEQDQNKKEKSEKRKQHQKIVSMTPEQQIKWIRGGD